MVAKPSNGRFKIALTVEIDEEGVIHCAMNFGEIYDAIVDDCDERLIRAAGCDDLDAFRSADKVKRAMIALMLRARIHGAIAGFAMKHSDRHVYESIPIIIIRNGLAISNARVLLETFLETAHEHQNSSVMTTCVSPNGMMKMIAKAEKDHAE